MEIHQLFIRSKSIAGPSGPKFKVVVLAAAFVGLAGLLILRYVPESPDNQQLNAAIGGISMRDVKTYASAEDDFRFPYPSTFTAIAHPIADGAGTRIVVESTKADEGFEITALPFDESGPLTAERILADIPDMSVEHPRPITISQDISALAFDSEDEDIGPTYEIWFNHEGRLYQARAWRAFGSQMEALLKEWRFR